MEIFVLKLPQCNSTHEILRRRGTGVLGAWSLGFGTVAVPSHQEHTFQMRKLRALLLTRTTNAIRTPFHRYESLSCRAKRATSQNRDLLAYSSLLLKIRKERVALLKFNITLGYWLTIFYIMTKHFCYRICYNVWLFFGKCKARLSLLALLMVNYVSLPTDYFIWVTTCVNQ